MNIKLYQINMDRDHNRIAFMAYENLPQFQHSPSIDCAIYDKVFDGEVSAETLEDLYRVFNLEHPEGYRGRSMSVSDVVEVCGTGSEKSEFHFCDSFGFRQVDFHPEDTKDLRKTIRVVMLEPEKPAKIVDLDSSLEGLQQAVGGWIEAYYPFQEEVCIVCNEEGKLNGLPLNRAVYSDGQIMDIIAGPCFICDCSGENFGSLSEEQLEKYKKKFLRPEHFAMLGDEIIAIPFSPKEKSHER